MQQQKHPVLLVGTDPDTLKNLEIALEPHYKITSAMSSNQAVASLQDAVFAAIIVDLDSLRTDGYNLLKQCSNRYSDMVRIVLASHPLEASEHRQNYEPSTYLVLKPWANALLATLGAAVKQWETILVLKEHLDLKSELFDIDRRLHPELDPYELAERAAKEMARLPEIESAAVYFFNERGEPIPPHPVKGKGEFDTPDLGRARSTRVSVGDHHLYTVRIGNLSNPKAAIALKISHLESDAIRYLDFVGRHCQRTFQLSQMHPQKPKTARHLADDPLRGEDNKVPGTVAAAQMSDALTTPSTVAASTSDALRRITKNTAALAASHPEHAEDFEELKEICIDLKMASDVMSRLLDRLKLIQNDVPDE